MNLDANASYSLLPELRLELFSAKGGKEALEGTLNPSSVHRGGQRSRALVEEARAQIGQLIGLSRQEHLVFTSGATEANNTALFAPFWNRVKSNKLPEEQAIISTRLEHPSVLAPLRRLAALGFKSILIAPDSSGRISPDSFFENERVSPALVSVMLANNETGQILPVPEIASAVRSRFPGALLHCDAAQALGKFPFKFSDLGVDLLTLSGHKIGALMGVGALVIGAGVASQPLLYGGAQEMGQRAGTENLVGIVSFGLAAGVWRTKSAELVQGLSSNRNLVRRYLQDNLPEVIFNFESGPKLPNTLSVRFPGVSADDLVVALDLEGVCIASGPACAAGKPEPSHVLLTLGLDPAQVSETIRISLEAYYDAGALEQALAALVKCVKRMRKTRGEA